MRRLAVLGVALLASGAFGGATRGLHAQATDTTATATFSDSGIVVRFPRAMSPDSITREMPVADLFSGYEWRVVLLDGDRALVTALVVAPNDSLRIHRYRTIKDAYMAGDLRQCQRNAIVLECDRLARGLVRDVNGQVEIAIGDRTWVLMAMTSSHLVVRLAVKRARELLWSTDVPLTSHWH